MTNISHWINQRLQIITQQEFAQNVSHRISKSKKNIQIEQEYYSVPLAAGCGTALLTTPKQDSASDEFGPLVILFHALGSDSTTPFWHWIYEFAANGISVLSIDWDGHGAGSASLFDIQEATRSIPLIINRLYGEENGHGLNEKRKGPQCFLMGHSFGATLALISVTRKDIYKHISGVIAVSPLLSTQSFLTTSKEWFSFLKPSAWIYDFMNKMGLYGLRGLLPPSHFVKQRIYPLRKKLNINTLEQTKNFTNETFENRRILRKVKTPVIWFHGLKDNVCPYYQACQFMLEIKSAIFSFSDNKRGHFRMIYNDQVTSSTIKFIKNNHVFYPNSN